MNGYTDEVTGEYITNSGTVFESYDDYLDFQYTRADIDWKESGGLAGYGSEE